jgi:hypothetical protein
MGNNLLDASVGSKIADVLKNGSPICHLGENSNKTSLSLE